MSSTAEQVANYRRATAAISTRAAAQAGGIWLGMTSWSDDAAQEMLAKVVPIVQGAQRQTVMTTAAYMQAMVGQTTRVDVDSLIGAAVRNGVDPMDVYMRAVVEARVTYNRTDLVELAVNRGFNQLMGSVGLDVQLSATHASRDVMTKAGVQSYRRVTRPGACGRCVAASDNVYSVKELLPIHTGCHCTPVPGAKLPSGLQRASNADDPTGGRGLVVDDSGEIGPVLDYADRVAQTKPRKPQVTAATATDKDWLAIYTAQLNGYDKVIAGGGGSQWMAMKTAELRERIAALQAA